MVEIEYKHFPEYTSSLLNSTVLTLWSSILHSMFPQLSFYQDSVGRRLFQVVFIRCIILFKSAIILILLTSSTMT